MHPQIRQAKAGHCPICGMSLVLENEAHASAHPEPTSDESYRPLIVIVGLILITTIAVSVRAWFDGTLTFDLPMRAFMAGFFLVFAGFKLIDLPGFAQGYSTYDLLARRWFVYGYIYPFLELGLGLLYVTNVALPIANVATIMLLGFSGLGVARKLLKHERFQCACLGTFLKVPLTKVTLIEDFGMVIMAGIMLLLGR